MSCRDANGFVSQDKSENALWYALEQMLPLNSSLLLNKFLC